MRSGPVPVVLKGYGLALAAAVALSAAGASLPAAAAVVWIGGAAATLALSALVARRGDPRAADRDHAEIASSLRRWEAQRRGSAEETPLPRARAGGDSA